MPRKETPLCPTGALPLPCPGARSNRPVNPRPLLQRLQTRPRRCCLQRWRWPSVVCGSVAAPLEAAPLAAAPWEASPRCCCCCRCACLRRLLQRWLQRLLRRGRQRGEREQRRAQQRERRLVEWRGRCRAWPLGQPRGQRLRRRARRPLRRATPATSTHAATNRTIQNNTELYDTIPNKYRTIQRNTKQNKVTMNIRYNKKSSRTRKRHTMTP